MADLRTNTTTVNGSTTLFAVTMPYINRNHISVEVGGVAVDGADWSWVDDTNIQLDTAPASGIVVTIIRDTPSAETVVSFSNGSALNQDRMDDMLLALAYKDQEIEYTIENP